MSTDEQQEVETHLDACVDCRAELEKLAATPEFWTAAQKTLSKTGELTAEISTQVADSGVKCHTTTPGNLRIFIDTYLTAATKPDLLGYLDDFEVTGVLGFGAMGIVLKATDPTLNRDVAIKVLSPTLSSHDTARERFAREARAAAAISHNNVVAIHSIAEWNGLPYLVMPFVAGGSLQQLIEDGTPLSVTQILKAGQQIASGLAAAHECGLVHRDIKPSNILLEDQTDNVLITDFGLAQAAHDQTLTRSGIIAGTPQYMSPEQTRGESIDARSDLFSLGSLLFKLATGRTAFEAETAYGVLRKITDVQPPAITKLNPNVPPWLEVIISRLMQKAPENRYQSAADLATLFQNCLAHVQEPTTHPLPKASVTAQHTKTPEQHRGNGC